MKTQIIILGMAVALFACSPAAEQVQEEEILALEYFGEEISWEGAEDISGLLELPEETESSELKVRGVITEVCQMKGCWMKLDLGNGETVRVTFKDYGFFVPKDAAGREVVIEGLPEMKLTSVETLRHYAEDAGKSEEEIAKITEAKRELTFEAKGVVIK
jgi:hypothetical protein